MSNVGISPLDESSGPEVVAQGHYGSTDEIRVDPDSIEDVGLDFLVRADERELEEVGAEFDDPQTMVTFSGQDDPDGFGGPPATARSRRDDLEGWDLDEPSLRYGETDPDETTTMLME
jgi:hypothetical protein